MKRTIGQAARLEGTDIDLDGKLSFDALQMRLHPAESRIKKLSKETSARLMAFDLLMDTKGEVLLERPLSERRLALEAFARAAGLPKEIQLSPTTMDIAQATKWLSGSEGDTDGVVCKRLAYPYQPGERAMVKVKRIRTADCVVGGFRYEATASSSGHCCSGSTTRRASSITSASRRAFRIPSARK